MSAQSKRRTPIDFSDLKTPGAAAAAAPAPRGPVTGVGLMSAALADRNALEQRNTELQDELQRAVSERGAVLLEPHLIRPSRWANRHADSFSSLEFAELRAEIQDAGGNVQPIKVRPLAAPDADGSRYELVFGHRRHRACAELGLQVLAVVQELDERGLFEQMERENRGRAALSAWEQGMQYRRALDAGLYPSARQLAAGIGVDLSQLGKSLRVAALPAEVVAAFPSPTAIQFRWAGDLDAACAANATAVRARAAELHGCGLAAADVYRELVAAGQVQPAPAKGAGGGTVPPPAVEPTPTKRGSGTVPPPPPARQRADVRTLTSDPTPARPAAPLTPQEEVGRLRAVLERVLRGEATREEIERAARGEWE